MAPHCVSTIHPTRRSTPDVQPETRKCLARLRGGRRTRLNSVGARLLGSPATKSAKNQICFPEGGAAPALSGAMYFGADRRIWPAEPRGSINRAEASPVIGHTRSFGRAQTIAWIRVPRGAPSGRQGSALAHIALRTRGRSRRRTRPGRRVRAGGLCAFPAANSFAPRGRRGARFDAHPASSPANEGRPRRAKGGPGGRPCIVIRRSSARSAAPRRCRWPIA
jgi:hypothetical protein